MARRFTSMAQGLTAAGDVEVITHGPADVYDVFQNTGPGGLGPKVGYVTKDTSQPTSREWVVYDYRRVRLGGCPTLGSALHTLAKHQQAVLGLSRA